MNAAAPAAGSSEYISGKIAPPQIPFNRLSHYRNRGMPVRRGREPPRARSLQKILTATRSRGKMQNQRIPVTHLWQEPYLSPTVKTPQNHRIPQSGYPCFHHTRPIEADPGCFPEKTGSFFPFRNPLYFSAVMSFRAIPGVPHNQLIFHFSRPQERG